MAGRSRLAGPLAGLVALVGLLSGCDPVGVTPVSYPPAKPPLPWEQVTSPSVNYTAPQARGRDRGIPTPTFRAPLPVAPPSASPSPGVARGPCLPLYGAGTPVPVNITTRPGPTVLSWFHNGDLATTAYWVGVQALAGTAQQRAVITWSKVTPPYGCQDVRFTVPGLVKGTPYLLWLDATSVTPETISGITRHTLNHAPVTPA